MIKPVILLGNGLRYNPGMVADLCGRGIPILTTWMSLDMIGEDHPCFCGRPGIFGQRAANIIQQKATHVYTFGARLDGESVAYDYCRFAPHAKKFVYDVDAAELAKFPEDWEKIHLDLSQKLGMFNAAKFPIESNPEWLAWCKALYARFRYELDDSGSDKGVDTFAFMDALSKSTRPDDILAIGSSSGAVNSFLQTFKIKQGQRVTLCASIGAMGADIPMAIGAALATKRRTICVTGDGGFQVNIHALEVAKRLRLDIHYFVFSNGGYNSIRVMQLARFNGRLVGANAQSGFTLPNLEQIAHAYGLPYTCLSENHELAYLFYGLGESGPEVIEVMVDPEWQQFPRVMASTVNGQLRTDNMEDMTPHLPPEQLAEIMEWGNDG